MDATLRTSTYFFESSMDGTLLKSIAANSDDVNKGKEKDNV